MLLLGASRGSGIALFFTTIILLFMSSSVLKLKLVLLNVFIGTILIYAAEATGSTIFVRLFETWDAINNQGSSAARIDIWNQSWDYFMASPLIGGRIEINGSYPHNFILEAFMTTGIIGGFALLIFIVINFFRALFIFKNGDVLPLIILMQGLVQHSFSGSVGNALIVFVSAGIISSSYRIAKNNVL
jgi:O-antigen ligase